MFNVANRTTLVNFLEMDINGETMVHHHKINEAKHNLTMVKGTIEVILQGVKVVKTMRRKSFIWFVRNDLYMVNIGPMYKVTVVVILVETIIRTNVANRIKSLAFRIQWPIHNNKRGIT